MDLDAIIRRFEAGKNARSNWENTWQEIGDRVLPSMSDFTVQRSNGDKRTEYMYDATAALAAQKANAVISTFVWPSNQKYQKLSTNSPALNTSTHSTVNAISQIGTARTGGAIADASPIVE